MLLNLYTVKGNKHSLMGPWIAVGYLINEKDAYNTKLETFIPKPPHIHSHRKNLLKFNYLFKFNNTFVVSISSHEINVKGEYAVNLAYKKIKAQAKSFINSEEFLIINNIDTPLKWYERLCCLYGTFIRDQYLLRLNDNIIDYVLLDKNLEDHLNIISQYKYLPGKYLLDKTLRHFVNIEPKPFWFKNEIDFIKTILNNDS